MELLASNKVAYCRLCNKPFKSDELKNGKCKTCIDLYEKWKLGHKKTPEEVAQYGKKRIHYKIPKYKKIYSVWQYNKPKYNKIYGRLQKLAIKYNNKNIYYKVNPYDVLRICAVYKNQHIVRLKDQRHIYRYSALQKISEAIAKELRKSHNLFVCADVLKYLYKKTFIFYDDAETPQAEYMPAVTLPLKDRIKANIQVLRLLRDKTFELEEITDLINWQFEIKTEDLNKWATYETWN